MYNNPSDPSSQYPGQQPGYPGQQPGYPNQQPGYPGQQPGYPGQQSGYPNQQPGGFQTSYEPPPSKKRGTGCRVAVVVVVLLLVLVAAGAVAGFYYYKTNISSTPQKTLAAYCDGLKNNNAPELYNQLDASQQKKTTIADVQKGLVLLDTPLIGGIKECTVGAVQENGSIATGVVTIVLGIGRSQTATTTLVLENGVWKIDNSSTPNVT